MTKFTTVAEFFPGVLVQFNADSMRIQYNGVQTEWMDKEEANSILNCLEYICSMSERDKGTLLALYSHLKQRKLDTQYCEKWQEFHQEYCDIEFGRS